ncbi:hypothetical protein LCGC14_0379150 [marine sediment metagenome]|uniref:Uncharacterized protein n=1 Tax=marine sediment metagenome TaxID=412755 RepID=A0A0F9TKY6_9ZZZZ
MVMFSEIASFAKEELRAVTQSVLANLMAARVPAKESYPLIDAPNLVAKEK